MNYYDILNVRKDATDSEIKYAYKKLVHKYHPDVSKEKNSVEKFKMLIKAYKTLSNSSLRMNYDKGLIDEPKKKFDEKEKTNKKAFFFSKEKESKKTRFVFSEIFNKDKLSHFINKIVKARAELRKKRFIERETAKISLNNDFSFIDNITNDEIMARLKSSGNNFVRANIIKVIAIKRKQEFLMEVIKLLSDTSKIVRIEAVKALGIMGDFRAVNFLSNSIFDYENEVRFEVAKSLRKFPDTRSISALLKLLKDKNEDVVIEAIYSIGVIGDESLNGELRKLFLHDSFKVKKACLEVVNILKIK